MIDAPDSAIDSSWTLLSAPDVAGNASLQLEGLVGRTTHGWPTQHRPWECTYRRVRSTNGLRSSLSMLESFNRRQHFMVIRRSTACMLVYGLGPQQVALMGKRRKISPQNIATDLLNTAHIISNSSEMLTVPLCDDTLEDAEDAGTPIVAKTAEMA